MNAINFIINGKLWNDLQDLFWTKIMITQIKIAKIF